jgi:SAM-dependent methyltransferase
MKMKINSKDFRVRPGEKVKLREWPAIIGLDYSEAMLARARARIEHHGWHNIELRRGDATQLHLTELVDGALCTLAIGLMPARAVLGGMLDALKLGGILLIADGRLSSRWYRPLMNPVLPIIGIPWLPPYSRPRYFTLRPWEDLREMLGHITYEELFGGTLYVAYGVKGGRD